MTAQIRPNRLEVSDRFPMLGFAIRTEGGRALPGIGPERQLELLVKLADPAADALAGDAGHWTYNQGDGEASFWVH